MAKVIPVTEEAISIGNSKPAKYYAILYGDICGSKKVRDDLGNEVLVTTKNALIKLINSQWPENSPKPPYPVGDGFCGILLSVEEAVDTAIMVRNLWPTVIETALQIRLLQLLEKRGWHTINIRMAVHFGACREIGEESCVGSTDSKGLDIGKRVIDGMCREHPIVMTDVVLSLLDYANYEFTEVDSLQIPDDNPNPRRLFLVKGWRD